MIRRYEVDTLSSKEINLGRAGENKVRCIEFDVRPWLLQIPDGYVAVYAELPEKMKRSPYGRQQRPSPSQNGYLAATEYNDGIVSWTITSADNAVDGQGAIELILYGKDGSIMQSSIAKTRILPSLSHGHGCGCGPSPMQNWVDQAAYIRMETIDAAERAEAAAERIEQMIIDSTLPEGGESGQVLAKLSDRDGDVGWVTPEYDGAGMEQYEYVVNVQTRYEFPSVGQSNVIYKAESESRIYQWNSAKLMYEPIVTEGEGVIQDGTIIPGGGAVIDSTSEEDTILHGGNANGDS